MLFHLLSDAEVEDVEPHVISQLMEIASSKTLFATLQRSSCRASHTIAAQISPQPRRRSNTKHPIAQCVRSIFAQHSIVAAVVLPSLWP